MRRFFSVSSYLSLGTCSPPRSPAPLQQAEVTMRPRDLGSVDLIPAERVGFKDLLRACREMHANNIPAPYTASVPREDGEALRASPEFQAALEAGEVELEHIGSTYSIIIHWKET